MHLLAIAAPEATNRLTSCESLRAVARRRSGGHARGQEASFASTAAESAKASPNVMTDVMQLADGASFVSEAAAVSPISSPHPRPLYLPIATRQKIAKEAENVESIELRCGISLRNSASLCAMTWPFTFLLNL